MKRHVLCVIALAVCSLAVPAQSQDRPPQQPRTTAELLKLQWSRNQGEGAGPVKLATFPLRLEDLGQIRPLGMMVSGHVTPSDHLYVVPKKPADKDQSFDVLAVADGHVVFVQWRPKPRGGQGDPKVFERDVDLKVVIEHSATCWSYVDHLIEVSDTIRRQLGDDFRAGPPFYVRVPVKAGEAIGKVGYQTVDFALVDATTERKGFVVPQQFLARDPWKPHTVDPFDYVDEPLRSKLLAFNPRKVKPLGGQIDYDLDGKLVGNWYRQNNGGYAAAQKKWDYWVGHLTIAYHYEDPSQIIVSLGDFAGRPRQFQVRGNAPDPAQVGQAEGMVKYDLVMPHIDDNTGKPFASFPNETQGTLLVQLMANRKLRMEAFPGKSAAEIVGFTPAALVYER